MISFSFLIIILFHLNIKQINTSISDNSNIYFDSNYNKEMTSNALKKELMKYLFLYGTEISPLLFLYKEYNGTNYTDTTEKFFTVFREELEIVLNNTDKETLSDGCRSILEEYLLGKNEKNKTIHYVSNYHLKKLLEDSSKHKNDLGSYDQCLFRKYKMTDEYGNVSDSAYVVFILDKANIKQEDGSLLYKKNSTDFEDMFYIRAFCLPQATQKKYDENKAYCSAEEYKVLMHNMNEHVGDLLGIREVTEIRTFNMEKLEFEKSAKDRFLIFLKWIPFILCIFHVIIIVFREFIIYVFKEYYSDKTSVINKDIKQALDTINKSEDKEDDDDANYKDVDSEKKKLVKKKKRLPNWIKVYNKCFNFGENFKELFNYSLNSTSINNDSGLTYIRGLKASCLFLLILGLTFFTFMNSLSKLFSNTLFFEFLNDKIFYSLFFIGLKYSPRLIFSCSGYTLAYKYLCYVNKNFSIFYIFKFIFYQIHKYLILIAFFIFERYTLHQVYIIDTPMWKYLEKEILSKPKGAKFILSFLSLSSYISMDERKTSRYLQTLIDYFWMPYNEISFFIIGVAIISIGYKYKLRIDYFLAVTIVILFIVKLLYGYLIRTKEGEIYYATLYYYLFDYGKFMINPLFNLPCYLIGMYFGIINYSVQKGIISFYNVGLFQKELQVIKSEQELDEKDIKNLKKNEEEDEDEDDIDSHGNMNTLQTKGEESNEKKEYRVEIQQMPFLIPGVKFSNWLRELSSRKVPIIYIILILSASLFLIFHFIVLNSSIGNRYEDLKHQFESIPEEVEDEEQQDLNEEKRHKISESILNTLNLTKYITNRFINAIFRIDIEIIVFATQSLLFILYFKGQNFINDFFCHIFWAMLNKSYFSYILVANPMILFIFYQSETKILLNLYNLLLYSLISGSLIFLTATFAYLFFELPYKRLIRHICSTDDKNDKEDDEYEDEDEYEKDSKKDNDYDEDD